VPLFNLSVLNQFVDAYGALRTFKNKGKTNDAIDNKCAEMKKRFADARLDQDAWIEIILELGRSTDDSQNNKKINQYLPTFLQNAASYVVETQSDLSTNFSAIRRFLINTILNKQVSEANAEFQNKLRTALNDKIASLHDDRLRLFAELSTTFNNPDFTDDEVKTKKASYYNTLKELAYLGDLTYLCDNIANTFPTFECPPINSLGSGTKNPLERLNHRLPWILHEHYDHHYIKDVMLKDSRELLNSLIKNDEMTTPVITPTTPDSSSNTGASNTSKKDTSSSTNKSSTSPNIKDVMPPLNNLVKNDEMTAPVITPTTPDSSSNTRAPNTSKTDTSSSTSTTTGLLTSLGLTAPTLTQTAPTASNTSSSSSANASPPISASIPTKDEQIQKIMTEEKCSKTKAKEILKLSKAAQENQQSEHVSSPRMH
jgi:hypothetical protein